MIYLHVCFFPCSPTLPVLLPAASGQGLQISGQLERKDGQVVYHLHLSNGSSSALDSFMMQLNKNSMGLAAPAGVLAVGGHAIRVGSDQW